jgi:hypothetical protein
VMRSSLQEICEIVGVPRFFRRTKASGNPAENRLIVRNTRSRPEASCFSQHDQSSIAIKTLFGSFT